MCHSFFVLHLYCKSIMPTSYIKADMDSPIHRGLFSDTLQSLDAHKQPPADSVH